jgi:hypothetical protein
MGSIATQSYMIRHLSTVAGVINLDGLLKKLLRATHLYRVVSFFAFVGIPRLFLVFARGFLAKFAVQFIAAQIVLLRSTITDRIESTCGSLVWTLITVP